jgi:hypothetical protein
MRYRFAVEAEQGAKTRLANLEDAVRQAHAEWMRLSTERAEAGRALLNAATNGVAVHP